jgi:hypothetical protein
MNSNEPVRKAIAGDRALTIAQANAVKDYRDLTSYRIELVLDADGWDVDYSLKEIPRRV